MKRNPFFNEDLQAVDAAIEGGENAYQDALRKLEIDNGIHTPTQAERFTPELASYASNYPDKAPLVAPDAEDWGELLNDVKTVFNKMSQTVDYTKQETVDRNYLKGLEVYLPEAVSADMRADMDAKKPMRPVQTDSLFEDVFYGTLSIGTYVGAAIAKTPELIKDAAADAAKRQIALRKEYGLESGPLSAEDHQKIDLEYNARSLGYAIKAFAVPFAVMKGGGTAAMAMSSATISAGDVYSQLEKVPGLDAPTARALSAVAGMGVAGLEAAQFGILTKGMKGQLGKIVGEIPISHLSKVMSNKTVQKIVGSKGVDLMKQLLNKTGPFKDIASETVLEGAQAVVSKMAVDTGKVLADAPQGEFDEKNIVDHTQDYLNTFLGEMQGAAPGMFGVIMLRNTLGVGRNYLVERSAKRKSDQTKAESAKELLEDIVEKTDRISLKGRSPQNMHLILDEAVLGGRKLYIRPETAHEMAIQYPEMYDKLGLSIEDIQAAINTNESLEIPVAKMASVLSTQDLVYTGLADKMSVEREAPSMEEFEEQEEVTDVKLGVMAQRTRDEAIYDEDLEEDVEYETPESDLDNLTVDEANNLEATNTFKTQQELDKEKAKVKADEKRQAKRKEDQRVKVEKKRIEDELNNAGVKGSIAEGMTELLEVFAERHGLYKGGESRADILSTFTFKQGDQVERLNTYSTESWVPAGTAEVIYEKVKVLDEKTGQMVETGEEQRLNVITVFPDGNAATIFHEIGHAFLQELEFLVNAGVQDKGLLRLWEDIQDFTAEAYQGEYVSMGYSYDRGYGYAVNAKGVLEETAISQAQHEVFADMFTMYLREGKAPTAKIASAFNKVVTWLRRLFFGTDTNDNGEIVLMGNQLTDDIRDVFARVFAEQAKIDEYAAVQDVTFTRSELAKVQLPESVKEKLTGIDDKLKDTIQTSFHQEVSYKINAEKKKWGEEARELTANIPLFKAFAAVVKPTSEYKLDLEELGGRVSEADLKAIRQRNNRLVQKEGKGMPVDMFLEEFGFESLDQFITQVRTLPGERQMQSEYKRNAEKEFFKTFDVEAFFYDHTDFLADYYGKIHDYARATNGLKSRATSEDIKTETSIDFSNSEAGKASEAKALGGIKGSLRDSQAALLKDDMQKAYEKTRGVLISAERIKLIKKFRDNVAKTKKALKAEKKHPGGKSMDEEFRNLYFDTAYKFGFLTEKQLPKDHRTSALKIEDILGPAKDQYGTPLSYDTHEDIFGAVVNAAPGVVDYKTMTVKDVRQVMDALKEIRSLGKDKLARERGDYQLGIDRVAETLLLQNAGKQGKGYVQETDSSGLFRKFFPGAKGAKTEKAIRSALAKTTKPIFALRMADGGLSFEGKTGVLEDQIVDQYYRAENKKLAIQRELHDILNAATNHLHIQMYDNKNRVETSVPVPAIMQKHGQDWTYERVAAVALNRGNEYNLNAIMQGYDMTLDQINTLLEEVLTEEDMLAIQKVWDAAERLHTYMSEEYRQRHYRALNKVPGNSFTFKGNTYQGGYYPVKFDAELEQKVASNEFAELAKQTAKNVDSSSTVGRVGTGGRPVKLAFNVMNGYFQRNTHFAAFYNTMGRIFDILDTKAVNDEIHRMIGPEEAEALYKNMQGIARPELNAVTGQFGKMIEKARRMSSIAILGLNPSVALKQPLSFYNFANEYGYDVAADGFKEYHSNRKEWDAKMDSLDPSMRNRANTIERDFYEAFHKKELMDPSPMDDMTREISKKLEGGKIPPFTRRDLQDGMFFMIKAMDQQTVRPLWVGVFNKKLAETGNEKVAALEAAKAIATTQPSARVIDLSLVERDRNGLMRAFTSFMTFRLLLGNRLRYYFNGRALGQISHKDYMGHIINEVALPVLTMHGVGLATMMMMSALKGNPVDDDDMKDWLKGFGIDAVGYTLGTLPVVSDVYGQLAYSVTHSGFKRGQLSSVRVPAAMYLNTGIDAADAMASLITDFGDKKTTNQAIWRLANAFSFYYGIPAARVAEDLKKALED